MQTCVKTIHVLEESSVDGGVLHIYERLLVSTSTTRVIGFTFRFSA